MSESAIKTGTKTGTAFMADGNGVDGQMLGLQTEVRNILRELADMRRQQGDK